MAYLSQSNTQQTSVSLYIDGLNTTSQYTEIYITCNGRTSPNLSRPQGNSSSLFWNLTGLSPGTQYFATYTLRTSAGSTGSGNGFVQTADPPLPDPPGNITGFGYSPLSASEIYFYWNSSSRATDYYIEVTRASNGSLAFYDYTSGTSITAYGLSSGIAYNVSLYARNSGGFSPNVYLYSVQTISPPSNPTNFRVYARSSGSFSVAWNTVSGAYGYSIEVYRASNNSLVWSSYNQSGASAVVTGLISGVTYNVKLYAINNGGNSSGTWLYDVKAGYDRPLNWTSFTNYASGQSATIPASTWNEFIGRIRDFFIYKDLNPNTFTFTNAVSGTPMTATQINQVRDAIAYLGPSTSVPSSVGTGNNANVETVKGLQYSLNSVA